MSHKVRGDGGYTIASKKVLVKEKSSLSIPTCGSRLEASFLLVVEHRMP
jgi:hypothetical protein